MAIVKKGSIRRATRCTTSFLALMPVVMALGMAEGATAADTSNNSATIDEVVITAQHRAQADKDVAETVSTINADNLDEFSSGGADITFLNARVPSLYASSSYGRTYPVFSIRGFGDNDYDYNAQQPVSLIYDNVVLLNPILKAFPAFDTVGLEVAKGPQGTLYGTDTPGGVIKIDSVKPSDKFDAYGDVAWGTYNTTSFNGAVGGPIIPGVLSMRLSLMEEYRDDWVTNDYTPDTRASKVGGYNDMAGRFQLLWTPDDATSVLLNLHARNMIGTSTLFRANAEVGGTNDLVPGFQVNHDSFDDLYTQKLQSRGASLTLDHDFGLVKLTSISGWESGKLLSRGDLDGGWTNYVQGNVAFDAASQDYIPMLEQYTQEVRLSNDPNSRFFNQGGVYVFHDLYQDMTSGFNTPIDNPLSELINTHQSAVSVGVFDSATYKVTDELTIQAGVRDSGDFKDFRTQRYTVGGNTPLYLTERVGGTAISWDGSINYKVNDDLSLYARVARGGKGPAIEGRITTGVDTLSSAKAEVTTSKEIGFKSDLAGKRAKLNFDIYEWDDRDAQLTATGGTNNAIVLQNAKNVQGYGVELEGEVKVTPDFLITGGMSYNHTEIQDPNLYSTLVCSDGCAMESPTGTVNGSQVVYLNHSPLQNAPQWIASWTGRYSLPLSGSDGLFAFTDWTYRGATLTTVYISKESMMKPLLLGGLRLGYENYDQNLEVSVFSRNILNTVQATGVAIDFVPGSFNAYVNDPRTFGIELKKHF